MAQLQLTVQSREAGTKGQCKQLREEGTVPGIVYGVGNKPLMVKVAEKEIRKVFKDAASENIIFTLQIEAAAKKDAQKTVMVKEIQRDPLQHRWLHVDFQEISLHAKLRTAVQVIPVGIAIGVAQQGGTLDRVLREVEIECLPTDIPEKIEVDISEMAIGKTVYVRDLKAPENVKILNDPNLPVLSVSAPQAEIEVAKPGDAQAAEPEVIREKKVEGEEAVAGKAEGKEGGKEKGKEGAPKKEEKAEGKEKSQK